MIVRIKCEMSKWCESYTPISICFYFWRIFTNLTLKDLSIFCFSHCLPPQELGAILMVIRFLDIKSLTGLFIITYEHRNLKIKPVFSWWNILDGFFQIFDPTIPSNAKYSKFNFCYLIYQHSLSINEVACPITEFHSENSGRWTHCIAL